MPDFDTRRPQEPNEPNRPPTTSIANRLRTALITARVRTLLIGGVIVLYVTVAVPIALLYSFGGPSSLLQELQGEFPNGKIAFVDDYDIFVTNADGTGAERNLTKTLKAEETLPVWSPDGEKIAFSRRNVGNGNTGIYVMNADGTGQNRLADDASSDPLLDSLLDWSPDGEKIAYISFLGDINVMDSDGSGKTHLSSTTQVDVSVGALAWSPDGEQMAFQRTASTSGTASASASASAGLGGGNTGIYVVSADGVSRLSSLPNSESPVSLDWSPDGEKIALSRENVVDGSDDIYVMNADGSGETNLTHSSAYEANPAWSPDGEKIAFNVGDGGYGSDIYVMNADGTGRTRLTDKTANATRPTWSPDGQKIAFWDSGGLTNNPPTGALCIINADGTGRRCVAEGAVSEGQRVAWASG